MRVVRIDNATDHRDQRIHPRLLQQAADRASGQIVFNAGLLLRVKEECVVQQQTQGQAAARPLFIELRGESSLSFM